MEHNLLGETSGFLNPEFLLMQLAVLYWEEAENLKLLFPCYKTIRDPSWSSIQQKSWQDWMISSEFWRRELDRSLQFS